MRVDCALLCDAVTAREGLLHILGGGITRLGRGEFPAPLNVALALRVMVHPTEADKLHELEARLLAEDGVLVARVQIDFALAPTGTVRPGEELAVAFPVPLHTAQLPEDGAYSFELLIDGVHQASVPFVAEARASERPEEGRDGPPSP